MYQDYEIIINAEAARLFNVSEPTIGKWIKAAQVKKNNLQLTKVKNRHYIIDNQHNRLEMSMLKSRSIKYRNKIGYEKVTVDPSIYEVFTESQLIELVTKIENQRIIPLKFSYLDKGADLWCDYSDKDISNEKDSYFQEEIELINSSLDYLALKLHKYKIVNVVDVGPGNGYIAKMIITKLLECGFKINYSAIDISQRMLNLLKEDFTNWFPAMSVDTAVLDIDYELIRDKLYFNRQKSEEPSCNLVMLMGSVIGNLADRNRVLKNFYESFSKDDFLWVNNGLKCEDESKFMHTHMKNPVIVEGLLWIPQELLKLKSNMYDLVRQYNESIQRWTLSLKFRKDVDIEYEIGRQKRLLQLNQNDEIMVWNFFNYTLKGFIGELNNAGFETIQISTYPDKSEALILCEVEN